MGGVGLYGRRPSGPQMLANVQSPEDAYTCLYPVVYEYVACVL